MNKSYALSRKQQYFAVVTAIVLSTLVVWLVATAATTIGVNFSTGGSATVSGDSYLANASTTGMITAGNGFISNASSTAVAAFNVNGLTTMNAGFISVASSTAVSTLGINGLLTTKAGFISTASSTVVGPLTTGALSASSTLSVLNLSTLGGGFISNASSTIKGTLVLTGGLNASSTATTTAQSGIDIATGCFSIGGVCKLPGATTDNNTWTGLQTFTGGLISTASSTISSNLSVLGPLSASSTLNVNSLATLTGGFLSTASSTINSNLLVSGVLNASSSLTVGGTISVTSLSGTSTIGSITIGPNGRIGIGTTTPNLANFEVATRTIAFNSGADGNLGVWATSSNALPTVRRDHTSVAANGYVYMIGGSDGTVRATVYYAKLNSDGSTGVWTITNALPGTAELLSSVVANGYVYAIGGNDGATKSTVYYAKLNSDGSTGVWQTNANALPAVREQHSSVAANGYVYVIGGSESGTSQSTVYYAKLNSDGSTGAWATTTNVLPAIRSAFPSVAANGYVYVIGGYDDTVYTSTVYYAKLNSNGSTGAWATATALPGARGVNSAVVANGYVYFLGGYDVDNVIQSTVWYAKLNSDGSTGGWATSTNALPKGRVDHTSVVANGYVYVIGGTQGTLQSTVFYASTARILISGNLDLLGLASTSLSDWGGDNGSVGGSIFAGNIFTQNRLEVGGNAQLFNGLGVHGLFSLTASSSAPQTTPIFSIQNATGTDPLLTVQYNGKVGVGSTSPSQLLSVQGNAFFSGNLINVANIKATGSLQVSGVFNASSTLSVGTTLASTTLTVTGSVTATSTTATTTVALQTDSTQGGCIQLRSRNGTNYRMYIASGDVAGFSTTSAQSGKTAILAVWEAGTCQ